MRVRVWCVPNNLQTTVVCVYVCRFVILFVCFCISFTVDEPLRARLPIPPTATLLSCLWTRKIFPSLPGSLLRLLIAMPVQHFYLLLSTFSRFPLLLRKPEYKSWLVKNRTLDFRTIALRSHHSSTRATRPVVLFNLSNSPCFPPMCLYLFELHTTAQFALSCE